MVWLPGGLRELDHVLRFSGLAGLATLVKQLGVSAPELIIGRVLTAAACPAGVAVSCSPGIIRLDWTRKTACKLIRTAPEGGK